MTNEILIKTETRFPVNRKRVKEHVNEFLKGQGITSPVEVGVVIVGQRKSLDLNRKYRQLDKVASVLAFSQLEEKKGSHFIVGDESQVMRLGDIVICYPEAQSLADKEKILVDEEIDFLIEHGLENLLKLA